MDARHLTHGLQVAFHETGLTYPNGTVALEDVTLPVREGEFVAIVGPSGCGKSTLLRLAAGLERPTTGSVAVGTRSVGFIFQEATLLPWASVRRNVGLLTDLARLPKAVRRQRVDHAVEAVGLGGFGDHLPRALSGGMRMRVSLARALALQPEVMLLDEPFGALDELTRQEMQLQLLDLYDREGFTALFVTHSVSEAVLLADRVVVMAPRPGRVRAVVDIDIPRPRGPELRFDPAYVAQVQAVSELLRGEQ
ncbi:ABC transporter ATP-binding protein [Nocardioides sp. YIM 152588]|uniref:ABC transporter ATP-binding protein n=1 Tax=Nocardioides sp. YIM 152588 TaxID=3158259 RepID=UPI0032E4727C